MDICEYVIFNPFKIDEIGKEEYNIWENIPY